MCGRHTAHGSAYDMGGHTRESVSRILRRGDGSGGALSVESFALDEVLLYNPSADYMKVCLPASFPLYSRYRRRAQKRGITHQQGESLYRS